MNALKTNEYIDFATELVNDDPEYEARLVCQR